MIIGFGTYSNPSIFEKLIMWAIGGKFTHTWLETPWYVSGTPVTIETATNGGCHLSMNFLENQDNERYQCLFDYNDISCIYPFLNSRYGWLHAAGFGLVKIFGLKNNPITGDLVCSGLVDTWLKSSPAGGMLSISVNDATPDNLYAFVIANPQLLKKL